jgi:hypothetical protein
MGKKKGSQTSAATGVQVFELTMDNPEDQDELNLQLQKPGEADPSRSAKIDHTAQGESTPDSAEKKTQTQ